MKIAILGNGYCGSRLHQQLPSSFATDLPEKCKDSILPFDFQRPSTWISLPEFDTAVITFKMTDEACAEKLAQFLHGKKIIILGSARSFINHQPDAVINEQNPLRDSLRNSCETHFAQQATLLHLGLIWGPGREPEKWLREGRIKNGRKWVNFIHIDDICQVVSLLAHKTENRGGRFLLSDGKPLLWNQLASKYKVSLANHKTDLTSKQFDCSKIRQLLPKGYSFNQPESLIL